MSISNILTQNQYNCFMKCNNISDNLTLSYIGGPTECLCTDSTGKCIATTFPPIPPPSTNSQIVYVNKGGNDATGNGSINSPYLTIGKAIMSITDASTTKSYSILIGPGDYPENLSFKPNMWFFGQGFVTLSGNLDINDPSWNNSNPNQLVFLRIIISGSTNFNFNTAGSINGQISFGYSTLVNFPIFTGTNNNLCVIESTLSISGLTNNGISMNIGNCTIINDVNINSVLGSPTNVGIYASAINGNMNVIQTIGHGNIDLLLSSCPVQNLLTLNGSGVTCNATIDSIVNISILNSATLNYLNKMELNNPNQWNDVNVNSLSLTNNQILQWDSSTSKWKNNFIINSGIFTPTVNGTVNVSINSGNCNWIQIGNSIICQYNFDVDITATVGGNLIACDIPVSRSGGFLSNSFHGEGCEWESFSIQNPVFIDVIAGFQQINFTWQASSFPLNNIQLTGNFIYTL